MSFFGADLREAGLGLASRVKAGVVAVRRVTPAVALLRLLVAGSLVVASALALPGVILTRTFLIFVALAVAAALAPRTFAVSIALVVVGGVWALVAREPPLWRILALAAMLYLAHASAAFAAVLPHDCAVAPSALRRWAVRTGTVVLASLGLGGAGLVLTGQVPLARGIVGPVVGALIAAGIAALIAWQLRRRT